MVVSCAARHGRWAINKYMVGVFTLVLLQSRNLYISSFEKAVEAEMREATTPHVPPRVINSSNNLDKERVLKARKSYPPGVQMGTKQMDSIMSVLPHNGSLLVWGLGNDSPYWHSATTGTVMFLEDDFPAKKGGILWGLGNDSPYWHNATTGTVMFLEDDFPAKKDGILWYDHIMDKYPFLQAHKVHYTTQNNEQEFKKYMADPFSPALKIANFPQVVLETVWDVILVDAPLGCCNMGPGRFQSLAMTRSLARHQLFHNQSQQVHVFVDDYERPLERQFSQQVFGGKKPKQVRKRKAGNSNANEQAHFVLEPSDCIVTRSCATTNRNTKPTPNFVNATSANGTLATLFVTLHAAEPGTQKHAIQTNTLGSLTMLRPEIDVVVFSMDPNIDQLCGPLGVRVIQDFESNPHETPYIRSMFQKIEADSSIRSPFIGYMNADLVFNTNLTTTLKAVLKAHHEGMVRRHLLLIGRRTNVQMPLHIMPSGPFALQEQGSLDSFVSGLMKSRGELFMKRHEDYLIITPGTFDWNEIPDFVIGRPGYDNWLTDYVYHKSKAGTHTSIDLTETVLAIHQTGSDGDKAGFSERPDKKWNLNLGENKYDHGSTGQTPWKTRWDMRSKQNVLLQNKSSFKKRSTS